MKLREFFEEFHQISTAPKLSNGRLVGTLRNEPISFGWTGRGDELALKNVFHVNQVHGNQSIEIVDQNPGLVAEADAVYTFVPGKTVAVKTADCVPLLLTAPRKNGETLVAAIHAGWRGIANGIVPKCLALFDELGCPPGNFFIAIGPHIHPAHYEVGNEVFTALMQSESGLAPWQVALTASGLVGEKWKFHVGMAAVLQLYNCGVPLGQIQWSKECTYEERELCSFRRDGKTNRSNVSWITINC